MSLHNNFCYLFYFFVKFFFVSFLSRCYTLATCFETRSFHFFLHFFLLYHAFIYAFLSINALFWVFVCRHICKKAATKSCSYFQTSCTVSFCFFESQCNGNKWERSATDSLKISIKTELMIRGIKISISINAL